ncbi:DUF2182 domain-containing protein [Pseudomonas sp. N040]|nr:DUF2182 domain-containing protein [Pseudomonas sp. N040]MBW7014884.1 DUF2182 domain-containing protein [Pseudomonas sp. N040]
MNSAAALMVQSMGDMSMPWTTADALLMFAMWALMMVAMMLPSALPMLLLYRQVAQRRFSSGQAQLALLLFGLGYLLVWSAFSLLATLLQWQLEHWRLLDAQMRSRSLWLGAGLLLGAGVYQWLPAKQACLERCAPPLRFILDYWQAGLGGSWRMGLAHGLFCLGCCWALMGLLFVGGVMNLTWVALLGLYVLLEKLLPRQAWIGRLGGLLLVLWGLWLAAQALADS